MAPNPRRVAGTSTINLTLYSSLMLKLESVPRSHNPTAQKGLHGWALADILGRGSSYIRESCCDLFKHIVRGWTPHLSYLTTDLAEWSPVLRTTRCTTPRPQGLRLDVLGSTAPLEAIMSQFDSAFCPSVGLQNEVSTTKFERVFSRAI